MSDQRERTPGDSRGTKTPRDVLADRIEQWADTEDWKVYDYADRLLNDLDAAGFAVKIRADDDDPDLDDVIGGMK